ncbi:MAG: glutamine synthetase, partial [Elusimicrobiota bacterium]
RARAKGCLPMIGSELEFYLLRETYDTAREKNYHNLAMFGSYVEDYHIFQGAKEEIVHRDIRNFMERSGVPIESSKGEWGPGQHEINLRYTDALEMADRHTIYKHGAKEIAMAKGFSLTFMAKFDSALAGSSCHLHSSLWDLEGQKNRFWAKDKPSDLFRHWLGGQMALGKEFSLFYAPTINSYKRYQSATFAPTKIAWAHDNRTCGFRVLGESNGLRVENRIPGADANPYLAFAATIAAGLYGIERKIEPPEQTHGNAYTQTQIPGVPRSLEEAIAELTNSKAAHEAFGPEVVEHYLHYAECEAATHRKAVTCWEKARYFERI